MVKYYNIIVIHSHTITPTPKIAIKDPVNAFKLMYSPFILLNIRANNGAVDNSVWDISGLEYVRDSCYNQILITLLKKIPISKIEF